MYMQLQETLGLFGTEETIQESLHPFKTNLNEAAMGGHPAKYPCTQKKLFCTKSTSM